MSTLEKGAGDIYRVTNVIWGAFVVATFIYLFVADQLTRTWAERPVGESPGANIELLAVLFSVLSLASLISAYIIWKKLPGKMLEKQYKATLKDSRTGDQAGDAVRKAKVAQTMTIMISAFGESCAIYGLVLVFIGRDLTVIFPFIAVSLISLLLFRPSKAFFARVAQKLETDMGH